MAGGSRAAADDTRCWESRESKESCRLPIVINTFEKLRIVKIEYVTVMLALPIVLLGCYVVLKGVVEVKWGGVGWAGCEVALIN